MDEDGKVLVDVSGGDGLSASSVEEAENCNVDRSHGYDDIVCRHDTGNVTFDLEPGEDRGTATYGLTQGTLDPTVQTDEQLAPREIFFVVSDASDEEFAEATGAIFAPNLKDAVQTGLEPPVNSDTSNPSRGAEAAIFDDPDGDGEGDWTFFNHPGTTSYIENGVMHPANGLPTPDAVTTYSPLKQIKWQGKDVIVNAPFVSWGDGPGEELIIDHGNGCDPLIRQPAPHGVPMSDPADYGGGPNSIDNGVDDCESDVNPADRYKGGQALDIDTTSSNPSLTMKLHLGFFDVDRLTYYSVFDASKPPGAQFMGVIHAPRTERLGRWLEGGADGSALQRIDQFANGFGWPDGGPDRFQPGITNYEGGPDNTNSKERYSPMWDISWLIWDCNGNGNVFIDERNVSRGAQPVPGQGGDVRFDPEDPRSFDPFQAENKMQDCTEEVQDIAEEFNDSRPPEFGVNNLGVLGYQDPDAVDDANYLERTDAPPGAERLWDPAQNSEVVNCPVPVSVILDSGQITHEGDGEIARDGIELETELDAPSFYNSSADYTQSYANPNGRPARTDRTFDFLLDLFLIPGGDPKGQLEVDLTKQVNESDVEIDPDDNVAVQSDATAQAADGPELTTEQIKELISIGELRWHVKVADKLDVGTDAGLVPTNVEVAQDTRNGDRIPMLDWGDEVRFVLVYEATGAEVIVLGSGLLTPVGGSAIVQSTDGAF